MLSPTCRAVAATYSQYRIGRTGRVASPKSQAVEAHDHLAVAAAVVATSKSRQKARVIDELRPTTRAPSADRQTEKCWRNAPRRKRERKRSRVQQNVTAIQNIGKRRKRYENAGAIQRRVMIMPGSLGTFFYLPRQTRLHTLHNIPYCRADRFSRHDGRTAHDR